MAHFNKDTLHDLEVGLLHDLEEVITEEELIAHSDHKQSERILLVARNLFVLAAAVLFILSMLLHHANAIKGIAYFFGAGAYISELLMMTDCFRKKLEHEELFMVYCFGPLYILMGLSYLFAH